MTDLNAGNATFRWTTTFFRSLRSLGIRHVVISPGSRSTPLTLAAAADAHLKKHVILDERSAAYTALGIGKATNFPAVLICTSGTAVANYYPAVIEARQSGIPMILATADRPPHLRATGANQAADQLKIFGDYPVFFHEVGEPHIEDIDLKRLEMLGRQAVSASQEQRGPVHLNFSFRKPLEPDSGYMARVADENNTTVTPRQSTPSVSPGKLPERITEAVSRAGKPLIIVGPTAPQDATEPIGKLAKKLSCPVLSESTINSPNVMNGFDGFLRDKSRITRFEPDLILRFGFQPTTKGLELALKKWTPGHHFHFASTHAWQDATFTGAEHIPWLGKPFDIEIPNRSAGKKWLQQWKKIENDFQTHLKKNISRDSELTDGNIYYWMTPQITDDQFMMVSNSFPARDIYLFGRQKPAVPLFLNRGVSGIDGITSTAIGLSLAQQKSGVLFTGDLAFLHDTNALLNHDLINHPLSIFVINNNGGSIFRMLPVVEHRPYFRSYFETPQSAHIEKIIRAYEIPYYAIDSVAALKEFDLAEWQSANPGLSVVECQTNADASMQLRKDVWNF